MATMKTLNGYGFNATELNGKAASDYLQKTDTATNSAKLGGKAPEYYIQPRNLLDNSDFRNRVNQRDIKSETSVSAYSYFIDRWVNQTSEARSFTLSTSGIGLPLATTLLQKIEKIEAGKIVTFAIKLSDGTIATLTGTVQYTSDGSWTRFATITHSFGDMYMETMNGFVYVVVYNTKVITIEWAALYEGSYTADTLPPYVPKGYAAELAECQRYFWLCDNSYFSEGCGYAFAPNECRFMISTPQKMRISPSIIADNNNTTSYGIKLIINGTVLTPTSVSVRKANNRLCLTLEGKFTTNAVGVMRIESQLSFSADL